MMMVFWRVLLVSLVLVSVTTADEKPSGVTIISVDPKVDARDFGGNHEFQNRSRKSLTAQKSQMPSSVKRELAFTESDLTEETRQMDALDRDILYLYAEQRSLGESSKKFPNIPQAKLKGLKDWVQKHAKD